ncbi:PLP-dependent aminotransferase family protein [Humitalea sp. 24SJ18S-53]|uniref:MocR-like pyridoxine biosynthesis transcription factor PdxR n=1 Tax=Humitalea sp. 24SJ18S-53 TaxID=3422307 RepID=UPI003D674657
MPVDSTNWADLLLLPEAPAPGLPAHRRVYLALRGLILDGTLGAGARLPPTRALARSLGVSRSAAIAAFEQLLAEGHAVARVGAGTFVAAAGPVPRPRAQNQVPTAPSPAAGALPFTIGQAAADPRTMAQFRGSLARRLRRFDPQHLCYGDPRGTPELRESIAHMLRTARGVRAEAGNIVIVSGTQHAFGLALRAILPPGGRVWVEDPCYPAFLTALAGVGGRAVPVPVDAQGLDVAAGITAAPDASAAYVTPSHQYPLGVVMGMQRRLALLDWARGAGAWIIEDDYDSEVRFSGRSLAALQGLDASGRVLYIGTFSKVLFPGLRCGYLVVPPALMDAVLAVRAATDRQPPTLLEGAIADLLDSGAFAAHLRRLRARHRASRDVLAAALARHCAPWLDVEVPDQGLHLVARLRGGGDDVALAAAAARVGIAVRPLSSMHLARQPVAGLVLGFTGFADVALERAAEALGRVLAGIRS